MVIIKSEISVYCTSSITDVDTNEAANFQYTETFFPNFIQFLVHQFKCIFWVFLKLVGYPMILF